MKRKLAGLAVAAFAAWAVMLGGCVADAGDDEDGVTPSVSTAPPPSGTGLPTVGARVQSDPVPNPWNPPPTAAAVTPIAPKHGASVGTPPDPVDDSPTDDDPADPTRSAHVQQ
jgi:hypothetical protein